MYDPPSPLKASVILTRIALRRRLNRMIALALRRRRKAPGGGGRAATPRKGSGRPVIMIVFGAIFLFNSGFIAFGFLGSLTGLVDRPPGEAPSEEEQAAPGGTGAFFDDPASLFAADTPEAAAERTQRVVAAVALLLLALTGTLFLSALGGVNQDLGQVDWTLEWLFTFPAPARALFLSKLAEYAAGNVWGWLTFPPLLFGYLLAAGYGFWGLPLALLLALHIHIILAALQLVAETWLRLTFSRGKLRNIQAVFTVLGMAGFFVCLWMAIEPGGTRSLLAGSRHAAGWLTWLPPCLPAALGAGGDAALAAVAGIAASSVLFGAAGVAAAQRLVRPGLVTEGGLYSGTRGRKAAARAAAPGRFSGVVAKDLRLLLRDRTLLVQTLFIPAGIIGFQILINPHLLQSFRTDFNHASAAAFSVGAYVMVFGAIAVLTMEGKALWLLFTFPTPLEKILLQKAYLWAAVAAIFPMGILGWALSHVPAGQLAPALLNTFMVAAGIAIYAVIAAGIGVLGTDVFEEVKQRKIRTVMVYLFFLLAGLYVYALYVPQLWTKAAMLVLCSLLACAIWQKVQDHVPYLLDPVQSPPPRLSLSDGLIAALAFFVLQGLAFLLFSKIAGLRPWPALVLAFAAAGVVLVAFAVLVFELRKVPDPALAVGLRFGRGAGPRAGLRALLGGVAGGVLAAGIGLAYLHAAEFVGPLRDLKREWAPSLGSSSWSGALAISVLAVVLVPMFEEFIFRGMIYRGLRRTLRPALAVPAAAAIFAIVHPEFSAFPVFCMGAIAAASFEWTGSLWAAILVHAIYNAGMIAVVL